jgi:predicted transposase YbfD/YdcC
MDILHGLRQEMRLVEEGAAHDGYWYSISDILIVLVCGMLCNLRLIDDIHDWAKAAPVRVFLEEQFKITRTPCRAQYYNILRCVDASKFGLGFNRWMSTVLGGSVEGKTVAVDGKTVCGTEKLTQDGSVLHIASALVSELNLVIGSLSCGSKTGEQAAFRELIGLLDVSGAIVVADALHCSRKSAQTVIESGADYLFVVKGNCPKLHEDIKLQVHDGGLPSHQAVEKNGGRLEKRTAYASSDVEWLEGDGWPKLATIGAIRREFENIKSGKKSDEWHYYISSAALSPQALLTHARLEWNVESLHWLLDVHFAEDKTRVWDMNVQKVLNTTRKIALNMVRLFKSANHPDRVPLTSVFKANLFDTEQLARFLDFFRSVPKLD